MLKQSRAVCSFEKLGTCSVPGTGRGAGDCENQTDVVPNLAPTLPVL